MGHPGLKFLVESKVPFVRGLLEQYGSVDYAAPNDITPERLRDVDAIVIRTRTQCNATTLGSSHCSMIATATIGTDHIDMPWCASRGIAVANAPGCNAPAVAQYVLGSLAAVSSKAPERTTLGIVGVGHVGRIVERWARSLGMRVLLCDPPRQRAEGGDGWCTLSQIAAEADAITFHTPLTSAGLDATFHMADDSFFAQLRRQPVIINSARGPVADTAALLRAIDAGLTGPVVVDCWENEPDISRRLLEAAAVATPHIAGYSRQGKWRASQMALDAVTAHFGLPPVHLREPAPLPVPEAITEAQIRDYNPLSADTPALKRDPTQFERLRNTYALRNEPGQYTDEKQK